MDQPAHHLDSLEGELVVQTSGVSRIYFGKRDGAEDSVGFDPDESLELLDSKLRATCNTKVNQLRLESGICDLIEVGSFDIFSLVDFSRFGFRDAPI